MKLKPLKQVFWGMVIIFMINGCASTGEIQSIKPLDVDLSNYKIIVVNVTSSVPEAEQEKFQLESLIVAKLREKKLFEKVVSGTIEKQ